MTNKIRIRLALAAWITCVATEPMIAASDGLSTREIDYPQQVKPILRAKCYSCHGAIKQEGGLRLDTGHFARKGGESGDTVVTGQPHASLLYQRVAASADADRMPPEGSRLTPDQLDLIRQWIQQGARSPADEAPQTNPANHWSFQRINPVSPADPTSRPIDEYVGQMLFKQGLESSPPASAVHLIRRMFYDLHGLPPTPDQVRHWSSQLTSDGTANGGLNNRAVDRLIDELLASPRYGERWAQHWLDVVRYADTHGFEVNTPRENAWPYRDYVIQALNEDKPYDQFVFEQLAGDSVGQDAATGFLTAAAVLLPGQIGKDDASKRLARQDELHEIIISSSASFLGLTLACARCHDHKFEPLTQSDYYAFQAFFAGVEYGERATLSANDAARKLEAKKLGKEIAERTSTLRRLELKAFKGETMIIDDEDADRVTPLREKKGHGSNPAGTQRGHRDDPGDATRLGNLSHGRYTWWDNLAGVDVFSWNPQVEGQFRLWVSWGVHGSGVHTRDARYVLDQDGDPATTDDQREVAVADQYYFAGQNRGASEKKPLWSGLQDTGVHRWTKSTRLLLRGGNTGTGITADVIVLQQSDAPDEPAVDVPRLRSPANPKLNTENFEPTDVKFIRFTVLATIDENRHEPCIDELEVYRSGGRDSTSGEPATENVALAAYGTKPSSSGNYSNSGEHQLKHINDGRYGNARSWISDQKGGGWIQLEFPTVEKIDRIVWGRDRNQTFKDRLPTRYLIEGSVNGRDWRAVATSQDRCRLDSPYDRAAALARYHVDAGDVDLVALASSLEAIEKRLAELQKPSTVYAGTFREPDFTQLLSRGDPEQPQSTVAPAVPRALGGLQLDANAPEQQRRVALARWITDPRHVLTARVMVNRIWQYHFGRGLVETTSDFGLNGSTPTHPELLDWLATEFIANGWSVKYIHRLIMSSSTYRQSSHIKPAAQTIDADTRYLWRFPSRRLEGEAIRDSILFVSGQLNLEMGGRGFDLFKSRGGLSGFPPIENFGADKLRRMIYSHKIRMEVAPVFGAFDCPDSGQPAPIRNRSTTPIQALNLLNSPFVVEQSNNFAQRITREAQLSIDHQIRDAFMHALGRDPNDAERQACRGAVAELGLPVLCRALFNSNEFLFIP